MNISIAEGKVVNLCYSLTNAEGKVLDRADRETPFTYLHGASQIVPGLENALKGLKIGDKKKVVVSPEEGYGEHNPALKLAVNRAQFPKDMEVIVGMQFEANGGDGEGMVFTIEKIEGEKISIDGNHPMAGVTLHFDIEVLAVRDATQEEMAHGHAHGGDGHHH